MTRARDAADQINRVNSSAADATAITISALENVGIGTSSPDNVGSTTALTINRASGNGQLSLMGNGTVYGRIFADNATGDLKMGNPTSNDVMFYTANLERMRIDATGAVTMPAQPAFQVKPASDQSNIPIGASTTVVFGTEIFDQNADFASNTFTAPVTGKYQLNLNISFQQLDTDMAYINVKLITSNRDYTATMGPDTLAADGYGNTMLSLLCDMDASDTVFARLDTPASGAAQTDVIAANTSFSGYLVA